MRPEATDDEGPEAVGPWIEKYGETYTVRERDWCENFLKNPNGSWAAREAGYSHRTAALTANHLHNRPKIAKYLRERRRELANTNRVMGVEELLETMTRIARADLVDVCYRFDGEDEDGDEEEPLDDITQRMFDAWEETRREKGDKKAAYTFDLEKARELGLTDLIKKIGYDKEGRVVVELYSKENAIRMLAQYYGILNLSTQEAEKVLGERGFLQR